MLEVGSLLDGKYKILNEIGHGGMSVVYLALNERANKTWAVKEVRKDGGNDTTVVSQGLVAETEMLKKLNHPNLPSIIDVIDKDDSFIIVMDYIEGNSLQDLLDAEGPQSPDKVIEWSKQLCDVLGYLHSRRPPIIYRDMKPANVMLRPTGDVTLIDFGTAREYKDTRNEDTTWLGTRGYAAPEQFGGRGQTDARTDIYTLGATMYHLITGYSPADTNFVIYPVGKFVQHLKDSGVEKLILKCCQPNPEDRYQNCAELLYALDHVHDEDYKVRKLRRIKLVTFIASIAIAMIFAITGAGFRLVYSNTKGKQYDKYVQQGRTETAFSEKQKYYLRAMNLDPGNPDAYEGLIEDIEALPEVTSVEYNQVIQCIQSVDGDPSNLKFNIDFLRNRNVEVYADFNFRFGSLIYLTYASGKSSSREFLDNALKSGGLKDEKQKKAQMMYDLASLWHKLKATKAKSQSIEIGGEYRDYWNKLSEISSDLKSLHDQTGRIEYPIRMCDEVANALISNCSDFMNASVPEEDIRSVLGRASDFMKSASSGSVDLKAEIKRVRQDIVEAEESVNAVYGQNRTGDAGRMEENQTYTVMLKNGQITGEEAGNV